MNYTTQNHFSDAALIGRHLGIWKGIRFFFLIARNRLRLWRES